MADKFECTRCGECCRPPRLYAFDIKRIKKIGYREEDFSYRDNFGNSYIKEKKGWCMFLKKGKKASCRIYGARPRICRQYPSELRGGSCRPVELAFDRYLERKHSKHL
ncbi:YkgJ family cysteine cluster protein [Candidatus Woesearchaeota archaeon]|nr:YkgJ family cysteine cluster protein [Candidatus Woesearchaeota archaeon]